MSKKPERNGDVDKSIKGLSGTHYVAAELCRRGYIASMTAENTKAVDILATNVQGTGTALIQVKTNSSLKKDWILSSKNEKWIGDNLFYAFATVINSKPPDIYIVPSRVVAEYIRLRHECWLKAPGRAGRAHKDNSMRHFVFCKDQYDPNPPSQLTITSISKYSASDNKKAV